MRVILTALVLVSLRGLAGGGVTVLEKDGRVRVEVVGALFTEYNFQDVMRPYFYPIIGPSGTPMTRDWPMVDNDYDSKDHPHHRGLWYAHGFVNGINFWANGEKCGKTVQEKVLQMVSGREKGVLRTRNQWIAPDGKVIFTDERTMIFSADKSTRVIDFNIKLIASHGDLLFADTKEGTMALRVPTIMNANGKGKSNGRIVNSDGITGDATWGKRAAWVDYVGEVDNKTTGVAIFDHPQNPRYPTWWHVRSYGLFAANPFGIHDFEKKPADTGDLKLTAGQSATFCYRFVFHAGDTKSAQIEERCKAYQAAPVDIR